MSVHESTTRATRHMSTVYKHGWKRCVDVTRTADMRLMAGGTALRLRAQDVRVIAADCATAERGVREGAWTEAQGSSTKASMLPPAVRACVAKHRSGPARSIGDDVTNNADYRFMEIVILPHSPVAALGAVVATGAGGGELQLVAAGSAWDEKLRKFAPPFPAARSALVPRVQRGWSALEAAHGEDKVFLACGRPSLSDAGALCLEGYSSRGLSQASTYNSDTACPSGLSAISPHFGSEDVSASGGLPPGSDACANAWDEHMNFNDAAGKWTGHDWQAADKDDWIGSAVSISLNPDGLPTPYPLKQVDSSRWRRVGSDCAACWQANC